MVNLKAVKQLTYDTRRLLPGEVFEARPRDARLLLATRKVVKVREPVQLAPPPPAVAQKIAAAMPPASPLAPPQSNSVGAMTTAQMANAPPPPADPLAALRAEYRSVVGKAPFMGWDAATLREKIAAAKTA